MTETEKKEHTITKGNLPEEVETTLAGLSPELREVSERLWVAIQKNPLSKEVKEFHKGIVDKLPKEEQKVFAFLPHQLAKTSIFFPMSDRDLGEERRKISKIEHRTPWGWVVIEGIKLAIFEEDIFLALLKIAKENYREEKNVFIVETNMNRIINLVYGCAGYSKKNEEVILRTLKHFELVSFDLITGEWKKKGKERLEKKFIRSIGNIISGFDYDEKTKDLKIYFNPRFFAYFLESMLTNINYTVRRNLKKDGSKALLRFISTHTNPDKMHILTVLNAINYNTNQPIRELRRKLKTFIAELKEHGVLGKKTQIFKDDTVYFDVLPPKKALPNV